MHDWMFEPGHDPLPLTLPEQPWTSDQGVAPWLSPLPAEDFETWLPMPQAKTDLGDVGPMFIEGDAHTIDDVIVPWRPYSGGGYYDGGGYSQGWDGHDTSQPWDRDPPPDTYDACEDRRADTIADQINNVIGSKPDSDRVEYGALIWRDDSGQLQFTNVTPGNNGHWVPPSAPTGGGFHSWSQVVGYVHSHPTQVYQNGQWIDVPPESRFDRPSSGDWQTADFYISQGASAENFTVYVSYNGQIKEFDSRMNTNQSRSTAPMAGHGIESGSYQPGASCP